MINGGRAEQTPSEQMANGSMKIRIFVRPYFGCNVLAWFDLLSWDHELHEDFDENCGKHCGALEKRGGRADAGCRR
jgi:hypothetical protein